MYSSDRAKQLKLVRIEEAELEKKYKLESKRIKEKLEALAPWTYISDDNIPQAILDEIGLYVMNYAMCVKRELINSIGPRRLIDPEDRRSHIWIYRIFKRCPRCGSIMLGVKLTYLRKSELNPGAAPWTEDAKPILFCIMEGCKEKRHITDLAKVLREKPDR